MLSSEGSLTFQRKFGTKLQEAISMDFNINGDLFSGLYPLDDLCMLDAYTVARLLSIQNMFKSPATSIITSNDAQENVPDEE
jgi:hypothetical protein